jgi:UDP-N-acetyl-D-mannosaminuronate dehydrogenase
MGLALVWRFGMASFQVLGFDTDASKVEPMNRAESHIRHIS